MTTPSEQAKRAVKEVARISHYFAGLCGYRSMLTDAIQSAIDAARADDKKVIDSLTDQLAQCRAELNAAKEEG